MAKFNYDSYCGLYCGACDIHQAYKTGYKDKFASFWSAPMIAAFLRGQAITGTEGRLRLQCHGCKSDTLFVNCSACRIRACAIARKVEHCIDCGDYPCPQFKGWKRIEAILPHMKLSHMNMLAIRKTGIQQWLDDQEKQWRCPQCRAGYAWYSSRCTECGCDLSKRAFRFTYLQSLILKLGIRLMAAKGSRSE